MITSGIFMHPAAWFILGALLLPLAAKMKLQKVLLIAIPVIAFTQIYALPQGHDFLVGNWLGAELIFGHVDKLSFVFLHVFTLMAIIGCIYGLHVEETEQHIAAFLYVAGSLGVTMAGDYLTIFIFWELMAFASTFLVWFRKKKRSTDAGFRYLMVHVAGGLILLAGIFLRYQNIHDLHFTRILSEGATIADYFILVGFALNAAVPPIHAWLPDAYPEATVAGAVFMCAFTTKTAVYVLARAFPGFELLMWAGAIMTLYGAGYATIENDGRRILAYHIISQVGYMVCAVGIGTEMAINGACAHAYAHILYKALLFMGVGSVLHQTGKSRLSELGGLYKWMPMTLLFTVIGGISISGFPLTSGFVSKSMIVEAAGEHHHLAIMLMLLAAAVGTFLSVGLKLPYFIWYGGHKSEFEAKDPSWNMQLGMAIAAFMCIFIGCNPDYLYNMLPFPVEYKPYFGYHVSESLQMFAFTGLGFYLLIKKLKPKRIHATAEHVTAHLELDSHGSHHPTGPLVNLDFDWFYRKGALVVLWIFKNPLSGLNEIVSNVYQTVGTRMTMAIAKATSWFDWNVIDGVIDGSARGVVRTGDKTRLIFSGNLQQYIGGSVAALFLIIAVVIFS